MADSEKVPEQQQQQAAQPPKNEAATNNENAAESAAEEQEPQPPKQVIGEWKKSNENDKKNSKPSLSRDGGEKRIKNFEKKKNLRLSATTESD